MNLIPRSDLLSPWFQDVSTLFSTAFPYNWFAEPIRIDLREQPDCYLIEAEVTGMDKEHIAVTIQSNKVTISGVIKNGNGAIKGTKLLRSERFVGSAERVIELPEAIDESKSSAHYENGLLTVKLAKKEKPSATELAIQ